MRKAFWISGWVCLWVLAWGVPGFSADLNELQRRIDVLTDEIENFKMQGGGGGEPDRVKLHGYGELHFNHRPQGGRTEVDLHRFVIGIHALLTDWIHLNAEIDFEHGAQELEFEFGYLDFLIQQSFNVRAGVMLLPVGFLNEFHEPPLFWSVERPELQTKIIPTTWNGSGVGIFGTPFEGVNYRIYAVNSVQSIRPLGFGSGDGVGGGGQSGQFRAKDGIRKGRLQPNVAIAEDFAAVGRLELTSLYPGLQLGFSFYTGETTQNIINEGGRILLLEGDVKYRLRWFEMNATIVNIDVDDAAAINTYCTAVNVVTAGTCSADVPDNIFGWNIQAGVHIPQLLGLNTTQDLVPFFLFERIRPQDSLPSGTAPSHKSNFNVFTMGISYMPIAEVALKADYQHFKTGDSKSHDQFNMGIAYMY
ncbi:MAG: hypothetical protein ACE5E9_05135 [Nitrospinaceae bacterium]